MRQLFNLCTTIILFGLVSNTNAQVVEIDGKLKVLSTDTIIAGSTMIVKEIDGTLAETKIPTFSVSDIGDTLFLGDGNWVISPGISKANPAPIYDYDDNEYPTVAIGIQRWMQKNLRTTSYNDGTPIPHLATSVDWSSTTSSAYCWYNNDSITNAQTYGALYNFYGLADTASHNICPVGWHVPITADWLQLYYTLGGEAVSGGKMKEIGFAHWTTPNTGATNSSKFNGVPGGHRSSSGSFVNLGLSSDFYSSNVGGINYFLYFTWESIGSGSTIPNYGYSIRCVWDQYYL